MTNSRNKGACGEREVCQLIGEHLGVDVSRNWQAQSSDGGHDITLGKWAIEVKRYKKFEHSLMQRWWGQAQNQCPKDMLPVLFYRVDRQSRWRVVVSGSHVGLGADFPVELYADHFLFFLKSQAPETLPPIPETQKPSMGALSPAFSGSPAASV